MLPKLYFEKQQQQTKATNKQLNKATTTVTMKNIP